MQSLTKRCLAMFLAMVMVFSMIPVQVFAEDTNNHNNSGNTSTIGKLPENEGSTDESLPETEAAEESEFSDAYVLVQKEIDSMLENYLGATKVTQKYILAAVDAMDWETYQTARWEIALMEESDAIQQMNEAELKTLLENNSTFLSFSDALEAKAATDNTVSTLTTVDVLDGKVSVTDTANSNKVSGGTVTITAKGSLFSKKTNNITITNDSGAKAKLSFDYSASSASSPCF